MKQGEFSASAAARRIYSRGEVPHDLTAEQIGLVLSAYARMGQAFRVQRCFLYFIQAGESGPVKIGITSHLAARFSSLRTSSPVPLSLLSDAWIPRDCKRILHALIAPERIRGEWFQPTERVMALVQVLPRRFNGGGKRRERWRTVWSVAS